MQGKTTWVLFLFSFSPIRETDLFDLFLFCFLVGHSRKKTKKRNKKAASTISLFSKIIQSAWNGILGNQILFFFLLIFKFQSFSFRKIPLQASSRLLCNPDFMARPLPFPPTYERAKHIFERIWIFLPVLYSKRDVGIHSLYRGN